jgi:NADH-quinone oxidoreductase subunit F
LNPRRLQVAEKRIVLGNCGKIDPQDIESYLRAGGFGAYQKACKMKPRAIVEEVKKSGLTGRGGAGFPCGLKWEMAHNIKAKEKYLICNADEGEVGQFKDKYLLSNDPFTLIEVCASQPWPSAPRSLHLSQGRISFYFRPVTQAIKQPGEGLFEAVDITVFEGAGAYVCGEESALMNSIEGQRGESRYKPPYPPQRAMGSPTIINNVETLMTFPYYKQRLSLVQRDGDEEEQGHQGVLHQRRCRTSGIYELRWELAQGAGDRSGRRGGCQSVQVGVPPAPSSL